MSRRHLALSRRLPLETVMMVVSLYWASFCPMVILKVSPTVPSHYFVVLVTLTTRPLMMEMGMLKVDTFWTEWEMFHNTSLMGQRMDPHGSTF